MFLQIIILLGGIILAVATLSAKEVGGLAEGLRRLREIGPFVNSAGVEATGSEIASFGLGGNWGLLLGIIPFVIMTSWAPNGLPQMATKFFAIKDAKLVRTGAIVCTILGFIIITGVHIPGLFIHLFYSELPAGGTNVLVPDMLSKIFGNELIGQVCLSIIMLLVLSASMSHLAAQVLSSAAAIGMDFLKGYFLKDLSEQKTTLLLRVCTVLFMLAALVLALLNLGVISSIQSLAWGAISGFFLAPYVFGTLGKTVTRAGALAGSIVGLACALLIPTLVKAAFPALAPYCTTVNACAVATVLPLAVTPVVSAFTKKLDPAYLDTIFGAEEAA